MSDPAVFPHDARSAAKTARAGIVTVNDLICEDVYGIMTRSSNTDAVSHTTAVYSLDEDTSSLVETSRQTHELGTDGTAAMQVSLLRSSGAVRTMDTVFESAPAATSIVSHDDGGSVAATFSKDGLKWDNETSSVYIGGDIFRIQYYRGDPQEGDHPRLRIQAKSLSSGDYVTKFEIVND